jgi:hypothetical protein
MFYLNKRIIFSKRKLMSGFKVLLNSVNVLEYKLGMNLGMPGGASLYSLSVAWVSNRGSACSKSLASYFWLCSVVAKLNQICVLTKRVLLFTRPFLCLKGSMLYTRHFVLYFMDPFK